MPHQHSEHLQIPKFVGLIRLIEVLLDIWDDKYIKIKRGNLGKRHWDEVVNNFNERTGKSFEHKYLKAKIDGLKKQYRHESAVVVN